MAAFCLPPCLLYLPSLSAIISPFFFPSVLTTGGRVLSWVGQPHPPGQSKARFRGGTRIQTGPLGFHPVSGTHSGAVR